MTNEARAESNKFTCLSYALQGGIRRSQMQRNKNAVTRLRSYAVSFALAEVSKKLEFYIYYIIYYNILYNIKLIPQESAAM